MTLSVFVRTQSDRRSLKDSRLNGSIWEAAAAAIGQNGHWITRNHCLEAAIRGMR